MRDSHSVLAVGFGLLQILLLVVLGGINGADRALEMEL